MFIGILVEDVINTPLFINTDQITSFVIKTRELTMSDGNIYTLRIDSFNELMGVLRGGKAENVL